VSLPFGAGDQVLPLVSEWLRPTVLGGWTGYCSGASLSMPNWVLS
jgi:hypothetical protein